MFQAFFQTYNNSFNAHSNSMMYPSSTDVESEI